MKLTVHIFSAAFLLCSLQMNAQNRTNVWELSEYTYLDYPNCELRYFNGSMDTASIYRGMAFFCTDASICDTDGNLLFYSNGLVIGNRNYDTLYNSVNFNPGSLTDFYEPDGLGSDQAVCIVPDPGNTSRYYVFSESGEWIPYNGPHPVHLSYSVVDMSLDGGLGGIVDSQKNIYAIEDTLMWGGLTAVKHANGRDWWVVVHRYNSDIYYKVLVTPSGVSAPIAQHIGSVVAFYANVQATFSPDGSKYCLSTETDGFDFMNFDRCTGEFSDVITAYSPDDGYFYGSSFSPNSRYIYASSLYYLYQYDTWDTAMVSDVIHVAAWDSFVDDYTQLPILFFMHQLAPDNKIYLGSWVGSIYLNVITAPDSQGLACSFEPHSFLLPFYEPNFNVPSFPNYDLGPLQGSPCDTLYLANNSTKPPEIFRIYPNPVGDWLNIIYQTDEDGLLELFDMYGKKVGAVSLYPYFKNRLINVNILPTGVYLASVTQNGKQVWSEKVVIER